MQKFIGVLDSGIGGLTVLRELRQISPQTDFVYLADHAFCPYGTKSPAVLSARVLSVTQFLVNSGAEGIVLACNTASTAVQSLRFLNLPVWEIVSPTCNYVGKHFRGKRVALLATNATVESGVYQKRLANFNVATVSVPCGNFVTLVEECAPKALRRKVVESSLLGLDSLGVDAAVLGCTHFPLLVSEISACLPNCPIVYCAKALSQEFALSPHAVGSGSVQYFTTGNALLANAAAQQYFHCDFSHLDI